jgi:hypothetical protein
MLAELARREKEANIKPDPDLDIFMKVSRNLLSLEISFNIKGVYGVLPRVSP